MKNKLITEEFSFLVGKMYLVREKIFISLIILLSATISCASSDKHLNDDQKLISAETLTYLLKKFLIDKGIESYPSINKNKKFKSCGKPLKFFPVFQSWNTIEVVCNGPKNNWNLLIRTRANSYLQDKTNKEIPKNNMIIVSKKSLKKGQIIEKNDLGFKSVKKNIGADIFYNIEDLVGRKLKQNISLGFPIRSRHLQLDWVINKGDKIDIIQSIGTVFISASGVALENGQKGEKIRVMNLSSEKNLVAWVLNEKKVTTQTKINRN